MPNHVTPTKAASGSISKGTAGSQGWRWRRAVVLLTAAVLIASLLLQINRGYRRAAAMRAIESAGGTVRKRWRMESLVERQPWFFTSLPVPVADAACYPFKVEIDARTFDRDATGFSDQHLQAVIRHLSELPEVEIVNLHSLPITDAGLEGIASLPLRGGLGIDGCPITDEGLAHLHGLTEAKEIWLVGTDATARGCKSLQRALPNCKIFFDPDGSATAEETRRFYAGHSVGF